MNLRKITSIALVQALACGAAFAGNSEVASIDFGISDKTDAYVLETVPPKYPHEMLQRGTQGRALLMLRIDETGEVGEVKILASSNQVFADAAVKSVKRWYFQPGTVNGVAVPQTVTVPVDFVIEELDTSALASL